MPGKRRGHYKQFLISRQTPNPGVTRSLTLLSSGKNNNPHPKGVELGLWNFVCNLIQSNLKKNQNQNCVRTNYGMIR